MLGDVLMGLRFLRDLPASLRHPVTPEEARATLRRRLENRETDFLALVKRAIYAYRPSPYRALLQLAGCEYGDLERLVRQQGVEGALRDLCSQGVYLTVDEFKGRRPAHRGSATIEVAPDTLGNPSSTPHVPAQTSGSRGPRAIVPIDLGFVRDWAVDVCLALAADGDRRWAYAQWYVPGGSTIAFSLSFVLCGAPPARWFSPVDPASPTIHRRYRWSDRLSRWVGRAAGVRLPRAEHVSAEDVRPILDWLATAKRQGQTPHLIAYVSPGVRLCRAAEASGLDLSGARLLLVGEPLTPTRAAAIRRTGALVRTTYASMDTGYIGYGCLAPDPPDDTHILQDLVALIQPPGPAGRPDLPAHALLITSLRQTTPLVLLNVSLGDQGTIVDRRCGCPMEALGWTSHVHTVRSFEKLTAGGMTFLDRDVMAVLDQALPIRFGGGPTDYQLVEQEDAGGDSVLRLLVHPRLGPLDDATVREAFLEAIGAGTGAERVMSIAWRDARLLRVERRPPIPTASGKILHLHVSRPGQAPRP
jgi:hypothetical protein